MPAVTNPLQNTDLDYMRRTLRLAEEGAALASPGAMVGAIIVRNNVIVGEGWFTYDGVDHAEVKSLRQAGEAARGATIYTSLEPCSHLGRTGPCAQALIDAGITRVVTAMRDPNPVINGRGIAMLQAAGVAIEVGLLEEDARRLNEAHITYKTQRRPFGILKTAMTFDGKIATRIGESRWITSEASRALVQEMRHRVDAVITGSGTFLKDKPSLTDRTGLPRRRSLLRVILDRQGRIQNAPGFVIFRGGLSELSAELYGREIQSFMLECGPDLAFNAVRNGIIDKIVAFVAPVLTGGREIPAFGGDGIEHLSEALSLADLSSRRVGPDLMITAYVHRNR